MAAQHVAEQSHSQGERADHERQQLDRHHDQNHGEGHAAGHEQLEEAKAVLHEADHQHADEGDDRQGRGHRQLSRRGEGPVLAGHVADAEHHAHQVHDKHECEDGHDEGDVRPALGADHWGDQDAVDQVIDVLADGLQAAGHDLPAPGQGEEAADRQAGDHHGDHRIGDRQIDQADAGNVHGRQTHDLVDQELAHRVDGGHRVLFVLYSSSSSGTEGSGPARSDALCDMRDAARQARKTETPVPTTAPIAIPQGVV